MGGLLRIDYLADRSVDTIRWACRVLLRLIVVFFAHPTKNRLFGAVVHRTELLLCAMSYTSASLDSNLSTACRFATLASWSMGAAESGFLDVFRASRMLALFAFGTMSDAKPSLHNPIMASFDGAFAANSLTCPTCSKFA
jgi:hypothetical protein